MSILPNHLKFATFVGASLLFASVSATALPPLYITDGGNVDVFNGGILNQNFITNVNEASGLAVGVDGTLYVASEGDAQVYSYNPATGSFTGTFVTFYGSTDPRSVQGPLGMTWGPDGQLYIADVTANNVHIYSGAGTSVTSIGGSTLGQPVNVAFNASGQLFAVDSNGVEEYSGGQFSTVIPVQSGGGAYVLNNPSSVAFSSAGDMYVLDISGSSSDILEFTGTNYDGEIADFTSTSFAPSNLIVGPDNKLYVSGIDYNTSFGEVLSYNLNGTGGSVYATGLNNPSYIAFGIPEPSTSLLALFGLGIAVVCSSRRRRRVA